MRLKGRQERFDFDRNLTLTVFTISIFKCNGIHKIQISQILRCNQLSLYQRAPWLPRFTSETKKIPFQPTLLLISERGDDRNSHPEPYLLSHNDGPDGGHGLVPAQLRARRRAEVGKPAR
jgi:hypothetical protein